MNAFHIFDSHRWWHLFTFHLFGGGQGCLCCWRVFLWRCSCTAMLSPWQGQTERLAKHHYRGHRYGLRPLWSCPSLSQWPKKALTFSLSVPYAPAMDPTVYGAVGRQRHFRILMRRLLPFIAAQLTTTAAAVAAAVAAANCPSSARLDHGEPQRQRQRLTSKRYFAVAKHHPCATVNMHMTFVFGR